ncbi:MAG: thioredoxin domain-containing protein [Candidatus Bathyarchaeota archaeon]|nr:thioredoxin domain-containing protein [Candidatus Bathyarchaeota archaeon]
MQNKVLPIRKPNRLIKEKSPYLLQHAYNPVDWYPWSNEAFEKAKAEDKPVFVSIGYSTCHWCHVMEKESFEDPQVAALMNEVFVCIKVDREERPDLDTAYMAICQSMGRNCGWPLNVIMTPNKNPFFVASYIPRDNRYGSAGMLELVPQINQIWQSRRGEMETIGKELKQQITIMPQPQPEKKPDKTTLDDAYEQLFLRFDRENGGFGGAPKFPSPHNLLFLLRYWVRTGEKPALTMVEKTLRAMRLGGIFDQVGLGFHRYSTDARWLVPHFEKMLYDQALLTLAYLEAYHATGALKFKVTAEETLEYVLRDLAAPQGVFFSAQDADSEGEEGRFYLWTEAQIRQVLPADEADLAIRLFGVTHEGNYFEPPQGRSGKNILHFPKPLDQLAAEADLTLDELIPKLGKIVNVLFKAREKRTHPARDEKVLVDWNGLMIAALARANQVLGETKYLQAAAKAADFILQEMRSEDGRLYHRFAGGETAVEGFLDDYACLVFGLIELYEAGFDEKYMQATIELTKNMIDEFWDQQAGGFYFTMKDTDQEVPRLKQTYDGAVPSGNSIALLNLLRLSRLTTEVSFEKYAEKLLNAFSEELVSLPLGHTFMLSGLDFALGSALNVVLVGTLAEKDTLVMLTALRKKYLPNLTVILWTPEKAKLAPRGINYEKIDGKATAYVCRAQTCMPPTNSINEMLKLLGQG